MFKFILAGLLFSSVSWAGEVKVKVSLSPAGSFVAKTSEITGEVKVSSDQKIQAKSVRVILKNLKTGIALRDKHTLKHLEVETYPEAILTLGQGASGQGKGKIKIKGIEKDISGSYQVSGKNVKAKFNLRLSDFKIEGIRYMGVGVKDLIQLEVDLEATPL